MSAVAHARVWSRRPLAAGLWCLVVSSGCQLSGAGTPEDSAAAEIAWKRQRLAPLPSDPPLPPGRCAAGQLCEDPVMRLGLRIPAACKMQLERQSVFVCWLPGVQLQEIEGFYRSRQAHITTLSATSAEAPKVETRRRNQVLQVRPAPPDPAYPDRQPLLIVQVTPEGVRLTGTAASLLPATP